MTEETSNETVAASEVDDLDAALAGYKSAIDVEPDPEETVETKDTPVSQPTNNEPKTVSTEGSDWRGNPLYYQSGKKVGQLRKTMSHHAPPKEEMTISGTLISGAMFIMLTDMLIPMLFTFANNSMSKKQIKVDDLQMSEKQKKDLEPVGNEVVKYLMLRANPIWLYLIATIGIYGINLLAARQKAKVKSNDI